MGPLAYATGAMGLAALVGWGMYGIEHANRRAAEAALDVKNQQIVDLKSAIADQQTSMEINTRMAELNVSVAADLGARWSAAEERAAALEQEINNLRATEERNAVTDPQARAIAARERACRIMRAASTDGVVEGCIGP